MRSVVFGDRCDRRLVVSAIAPHNVGARHQKIMVKMRMFVSPCPGLMGCKWKCDRWLVVDAIGGNIRVGPGHGDMNIVNERCEFIDAVPLQVSRSVVFGDGCAIAGFRP